jgi:hypothetical protein
MVSGAEILKLAEPNIEKRRVFFEQVYQELRPKGYITRKIGKTQRTENLFLTDEDRLLHIWFQFILGSAEENAYKELPISYHIKTTTKDIPRELSDVFIKPFEHDYKSVYTWRSDAETIKLTDVKVAADTIDSRFSTISKRLMTYKTLLLPYDSRSEYSTYPLGLDAHTKFYKDSNQVETNRNSKFNPSLPHHSPSDMVRIIEALSRKYMRLTEKWNRVDDYFSFFDYLLTEVNGLKRLKLLKYLRMHDEAVNLPKKPELCNRVCDINDLEFVPLLTGLHKYFPSLIGLNKQRVGVKRLRSFESNLINIVTQRKLAELVAKDILNNPITYTQPEVPFDLSEYLTSRGYEEPLIIEGPYWHLLLGLDYWLNYSFSFDDGVEKNYKHVTKLLPEGLMKATDKDDLFLALLPTNLRKKMEYIYQGTPPTVISSPYLSREEKIRILFKLPGFADSEEEILPKLNLGMIKFSEVKKMGLENLNGEMLDLATQISPFISKEELVEFFSKKLVEIYVREKGFQVNRGRALELVNELHAQISLKTSV